uniref:ABC-type transport system involved in multi-copper enzyme maturation, permease component n=1 Tax=uncultured myxobacterium HF0200_01L06 TaxID=723556 RepID=E7C3I8_9BACT|nr:hypothetical protein [uncultured myxobacterium HF0200_01L06]
MSANRILVAEAVRDASRRKIVAVIFAMSVISLFFVDGCVSCSSVNITVEGEARSLPDVAGVAGAALITLLGLWGVLLAGILSADHLQQTLEDGSANLTLTRPVSRNQFAAARLLGALAVSLTAAFVLLGVAGFWLDERNGLAMGPVFISMAACLVGAVTTGALGMLSSLWLPRIATTLAVVLGVAVMTVANGVALFREAPGQGLLALIDRLGPPLASSLWLPLGSWTPQIATQVDPVFLGLRALLWAALSVAALLFAFRRAEIGR